MKPIWYDVCLDPDSEDPSWVDIERVYCFDWDQFLDQDWYQLQNLYVTLPGYQTETKDDFPRWFSSKDDPDVGYLWASVEPHGLQVAGTLRLQDWESWHDSFVKGLPGLPLRNTS